jgi:hypothetical protein
MSTPTPAKKELRKFGLGLFVILGLIGGLLLWRGRLAAPYFLAVSGLSLLLSLAWARGLTPVYRFMMWLAEKLAWFNTRLILILVFYLIFAPIGLVLRIMGRDLLNQEIDPQAETYWVDRRHPPFEQKWYLNQF